MECRVVCKRKRDRERKRKRERSSTKDNSLAVRYIVCFPLRLSRHRPPPALLLPPLLNPVDVRIIVHESKMLPFESLLTHSKSGNQLDITRECNAVILVNRRLPFATCRTYTIPPPPPPTPSPPPNPRHHLHHPSLPSASATHYTLVHLHR